jgi:hypothetical protein
LKPPPDCGRVTFTVSEVLPLLRGRRSADPGMLHSIEAFMGGDAAGTVEYNVTILRSRDKLMLVDGNKRTIAFYERRRGGEDMIEYPIFVIES